MGLLFVCPASWGGGSDERFKALRLHGRYLGYIRQLKPRAKAEVRALRAKRGVKAAIKRARKLAES